MPRRAPTRVARTAIAVNQRYAEDAGGHLAASIAYYGFLSLFPLLLLALSIVGFVLAGDERLRGEVEAAVARSVPGIEALLGRSLGALVERRVEAGAIGLVGLLWTGTGVVAAGRNALRVVFREGPLQGGLRFKAWLVGVTVALGAPALVATALAAMATGLEAGGPVGLGLRVAGVAVAFGLDLALFLLTYRVLVRRRRAWGDLLPGALFAAIAWTALKLLGGWYARATVANAVAVYGGFAAAIGVLVLLYLAGRVFVYGAELNAVMIERRGGGPMAEERTDGGGQVTDPRERSTVQLVGQVAGDIGTLVRKEVELARQEVTEAIGARVKAVAALGVVGVLGLFVLGFLAAAGAAALAIVFQLWAALLIVAGAFLLLALGALLFARTRIRRPPMTPERTKQTLKEDVEWAKAQLRR